MYQSIKEISKENQWHIIQSTDPSSVSGIATYIHCKWRAGENPFMYSQKWNYVLMLFPNIYDIFIAYKHMDVGIETEAAQCLFRDYINLIVGIQCRAQANRKTGPHPGSNLCWAPYRGHSHWATGMSKMDRSSGQYSNALPRRSHTNKQKTIKR